MLECRVGPLCPERKRIMIYEEAIVDGVLCWRNSPRNCKGHGPWIQKTPQELTAMLLEARNAVRMHPVTVMNPPAIVMNPQVIVAPQPMAIPTYPDLPWTVTY